MEAHFCHVMEIKLDIISHIYDILCHNYEILSHNKVAVSESNSLMWQTLYITIISFFHWPGCVPFSFWLPVKFKNVFINCLHLCKTSVDSSAPEVETIYLKATALFHIRGVTQIRPHRLFYDRKCWMWKWKQSIPLFVGSPQGLPQGPLTVWESVFWSRALHWWLTLMLVTP